jgi:hypothetical protein
MKLFPRARPPLGLGHFLLALTFFYCSYVTAKPLPTKPLSILGDWEITQLLVTDGISNSQRFMKPDDANVMGRRYRFQLDSVIYKRDEKRCTLDTSLAQQRFPIKTLFADERVVRPTLITRKFYRRAAQYNLGSLARASVAIYAYRCGKSNERETRVNNMGNWFAATGDTIIWPLAPDALVVMKRQPKTLVPEHATFCKSATSANDKVICADREMWLMKVFTENVRDCAIAYDLQTPAQLRDQLDAFVTQRNACDGSRDCVYDVLDEHASILAQSIPSVSGCAALKK